MFPKPRQIYRASSIYQELATSPSWTCEPKKNGYRASAGGGAILSRNGARLADWPHPIVCDGEWMRDGTGFWAFDLLSWSRDCRALPYGRRRMLLEQAARELGVQIVPLLNGPDPLPGALAAGHEGVVFKRLDQPYPCQAVTPWWVKCKG